jgi:hypothetical protein
MLQLELVCFGLGNFERLEIVVELNLLVEGLLERVITIEELGFCGKIKTRKSSKDQVTYR